MAGIQNIHEKYMKEALKQAKKALALGEVPIGCVIVHKGKIIGRGYNRRNTDKSTLAHAEITAIRKASKYIGDWRLEECTIYIGTLSDVCRRHYSGPYTGSGHGLHESESRLRRLCFKHSGDAPVQPSGPCHQRHPGTGMRRPFKILFHRFKRTQQERKSTAAPIFRGIEHSY